ncbi:MAG: Arc family DNA-binding protein [bacterium]|nr:Arc family DNA-binding protein [bacterium]
MPDILITKVPADLHRLLKEEAARHHRSMARHALAIIEDGLLQAARLELPEPIKTAKPLTQKIINEGIKEGRA